MAAHRPLNVAVVALANKIARTIERTETTTRVRQRSGRSNTKERWHAERLRKARRGVIANRSDRDPPNLNHR